MIRLRAFLKHQRYKIAIAAVLSALSLAVALEHSGVGQDHIGEAVSMCLAVFDGAVLLLLTAGAPPAVRHPRPPRTTRDPAPLALLAPAMTPGAARDGPSLLQVFLR